MLASAQEGYGSALLLAQNVRTGCTIARPNSAQLPEVDFIQKIIDYYFYYRDIACKFCVLTRSLHGENCGLPNQ
jgi:hypothetical protein